MSATWKTRCRRLLIGATTVMAAVLLLVSGLFPWSPLNCWHEEVDVCSGRIRRTWVLLYCQVSQREEETWLSRAATPARRPAEWRRVNTFSPGTSHSPHYAFHGAINQIQMLEKIDQWIPLEPAARREVADHVLAEWQEDGIYVGAESYLDRFLATAIALEEQGASTVTAADLP